MLPRRQTDRRVGNCKQCPDPEPRAAAYAQLLGRYMAAHDVPRVARLKSQRGMHQRCDIGTEVYIGSLRLVLDGKACKPIPQNTNL